MPTDTEQIIYYLSEDYLIKKQDNGLYAVTNAGALLFAKKLSEFQYVSRKRLRVIQYNGNSRISTKNDITFDGGYASSFEEIIRYIGSILPKTENIENGIRTNTPHYPEIILRELIANALIHQDFIPTGVGPTVEIFNTRIEITNPGVPLVDINRILDNPPKSRNEILAALMRRFGICEEQGSGWDKVAAYSEIVKLPAPKIVEYHESTKVTVSDFIPLNKMSREDRIWACYLHACLKYSNGEQINNSSLRERFGLPNKENSRISRLIKETVENKLIKPFDSETAPRYMQYVPFWA
ncbi:MAG: ATP-binding protein [Methanocorpusculum sp.]|nr:ATP-binding protein [Methanocorpusculum sp.]